MYGARAHATLTDTSPHLTEEPHVELRRRPCPYLEASALSWQAAIAPYTKAGITGIGLVLSIGIITALNVKWEEASGYLTHLYYVPILYAAARKGVVAGASLALASGMAAAPFVASPGSGAADVFVLMARMLSLALVASVTSWFARQEPRPWRVIIDDIRIWSALRFAVHNGGILVHYQPIVRLEDGVVEGVEALARWRGKNGTLIPPMRFIPVAERMGSIGEIGSHVLEASTRQARYWSRGKSSRLSMCVNVSAVQLTDPAFPALLSRVAAECAETQADVCLEITETALMVDPAKALHTLELARALNMTIAVDDFGTGQSSLARLAGFPIDVIKIDKSFVDRMLKDDFALAVIRAVTHLAESLGAVTVAEGIETKEQLEALRELGCTLGQGYYLGRPSGPSDVDWAPRVVAAV